MPQQKQEAIQVDMDKLSDQPEGSEVAIDASQVEDAWKIPLPPPAGYYDLKLFPSQLGVVRDPTTEDFRVNLECRIKADDDPISDNATVFAMASTTIGRGKNISTMAALLIKMGKQVPERITKKALLELFWKALKQEPILYGCKIEWKGYSKENKRNVVKNYEQWPTPGLDYDKKKISISVPYKIDKQILQEEIRPQLVVETWGYASQAKANEMKAKSSSGGGGNGSVSFDKPSVPVAAAIVDETHDISDAGLGHEQMGFDPEDLAAAIES